MSASDLHKPQLIGNVNLIPCFKAGTRCGQVCDDMGSDCDPLDEAVRLSLFANYGAPHVETESPPSFVETHVAWISASI